MGKLDTILANQDQIKQHIVRPNTDRKKEDLIADIREVVYEIHPNLLEAMRGDIMATMQKYKANDNENMSTETAITGRPPATTANNFDAAKATAGHTTMHTLQSTDMDTADWEKPELSDAPTLD